MYDYGYEQAASGLAGFAIFSLVMWIIVIAVSVVNIIAMWKVFTKAGKPGWAAIIPIYNLIVLLEITELPMWYIALYCVPGANIFAMFKIYIELAKKFGKSTGFGVGMVFFTPIFMAILAFDKEVVYQNGQVATVQQMNYQQPMNQQMVNPTNEPIMQETPVQPIQPMNQPVMNESVQPVVPQVQQTIEPIQPVEPVIRQSQPQQINPEPVNPETPKFCTKCGAQAIPNTKFCVKCGNQL